MHPLRLHVDPERKKTKFANPGDALDPLEGADVRAANDAPRARAVAKPAG